MEVYVEEIKRKIISVLRRYDIVHAAIFGSCAREKTTEDSDIDIFVDFEDRILSKQKVIL